MARPRARPQLSVRDAGRPRALARDPPDAGVEWGNRTVAAPRPRRGLPVHGGGRSVHGPAERSAPAWAVADLPPGSSLAARCRRGAGVGLLLGRSGLWRRVAR